MYSPTTKALGVSKRWVSWAMGRNFGLWHQPFYATEARPQRTKCWTAIPAKARMCWTTTPPGEQRCEKCLELLKASDNAVSKMWR